MSEGIVILDQLALWGGAECTINRVQDRYRDQSAMSGLNGIADDLELIAGLGITALRYPLLWESFALADDAEQLWQWHDARLARLAALGVRPIIGLIHHGSGPPGVDLLSPDFARGLASHAALAARRYPWVRDWTPVNEPLTTARFSALYGHWYPHSRSETHFWTALFHQIDATRAAMSEIRAINSAARLVQTDDLGLTLATPERQLQADFDNARRWAGWDLLAGRLASDHPLWQRLVNLGHKRRLDFALDQPCIPDLLGINHYLTSDRFLDHRPERHPPEKRGACDQGDLADVEAVRVLRQPPGLAGAIQECWDRYKIPIALTEVHNGCTREEQLRWMSEAWDCALSARARGIVVEAVTAWSLLGSHDWNSLLMRDTGHYESGVFDIRGPDLRETALAPLLRQLAAGEPGSHPVLSRSGWWKRHSATRITRPLLITGASGTLGQAFAAACEQRGIDHVLTNRKMLDLGSPCSIASALDNIRPWAVINCAGWVRVDDAEAHPEACLATNYIGALALANACALRDVHYTGFSSDLVFDGELSHPYVESDLAGPLGVYGTSKLLADTALQIGGRWLTVRTASFFSPYDQHNFAVHLANALRSDQLFVTAEDCTTSPTYVPDLVLTTLDLVIDDEIGLWHLVNDGAATWAGFAVHLADALALPKKLIRGRPAATMGWAARRPANAALTSQRGLLMPPLSNAIDRFAVAMRAA